MTPAENAATVRENAERIARGLRASREFLNSLPLNDGASKRAIDREFIGVKLIPDALAALDALAARVEELEAWQREAVALIAKTTYNPPGWSGPDAWWKPEADALIARAALAGEEK